MKNVKLFGLGLALILGLGFSSTTFAQTSAQTAQAGKPESCCSMDSCCKGESCSMKDHAKKEHATSESAHKDGCCCCSGDSCDMKTQHSKKMNHSAKEACCKGDSCAMSHEMKEHGQKAEMKKEHSMTGMHAEKHQGMTAATDGNKDACCCCSGDSCDMKMAHEPEKAKG